MKSACVDRTVNMLMGNQRELNLLLCVNNWTIVFLDIHPVPTAQLQSPST